VVLFPSRKRYCILLVAVFTEAIMGTGTLVVTASDELT